MEAGGEGGRDPREVLKERFPDLVPAGAPTLLRINGCGLGVYGSRDRDEATGTYVTTHCLCVLFVPVLALAAYRIKDAPTGGWYFLGRQPLSGLARTWNKLVLAGALTLGATLVWAAHTDSPEYRATEALTSARAAEARGDLEAAARGYAGLASTPRRAEGQAGLTALLGERAPPVSVAPLGSLVRVAAGSPYARACLDAPAKARLGKRALDAAADDPRGGLALMEALRPVDPAGYEAARRPLLEALVQRFPDDVDAVVQLAVLLEEREDGGRAVELLRPLEARLGGTEGARILGQALAADGDLDGSRGLLVPYVEARLAELHAAETAYEDAATASNRAALALLNSNGAPPAWYAGYKRAPKAEQDAMVERFTIDHMKKDPLILRAGARLERANAVVPVALDLGIVELNRAQGLAGPARQAELEAAERVFMAIQGAARGSPAFKLSLAQVYFWLSREKDGRALLDEQLAGDRSPLSLLQVARVLREVGVRAQAATLAEEAWTTGTDDPTKQAAASLRSVLSDGLADRIAWLERCDPKSVAVQADLEDARAHQGLARGDRAVAARHAREAARLRRTLPESAVTLNNTALSLSNLFDATGDPADFDAYVATLEKAERLDTQSSVLALNVTYGLIARAALRAIGDRLDLRAADASPAPGLLAWLYADAAGQAREERALAAQPDHAAALGHLDRLHVIAPKDPTSYALHVELLGRDAAGVAALARAVDAAGLDPGEAAAALQALVAPPDADDLAGARASVAALESSRPRLDAAAPATRALGLGSLALARLRLHGLEVALAAPQPSVDLDDVVRLAEAAHQASASNGSQGALMSALLARGAARVAAASPAFAAMRRRVGRALGTPGLVAAALQGPDREAREALARDPDVRRAAEVVAARVAALPSERGPWDWALLEPILPERAAEVAGFVQQDEVGRLRRRLHAVLEPTDAMAPFSTSWAARLAGDLEGAKAALVEAAQRGLPLPYDP